MPCKTGQLVCCMRIEFVQKINNSISKLFQLNPYKVLMNPREVLMNPHEVLLNPCEPLLNPLDQLINPRESLISPLRIIHHSSHPREILLNHLLNLRELMFTLVNHS